MATWKKSAMLVLVLVLSIAMVACGAKTQPSTDASNGGEAAANNPLAGKKIALIMQINLGTFSAQYIEGVKEQVQKLGGTVTVNPAEGDLAKMASNLDAAINQKVDGILIDHGTAEALEAGVKRALEKKIPVVAFDADLKVPGVTVLEQGDQKMAEQTLEQLAKDIGGKGNIVKIWVAGFAPMERRQIAYKAFQAKYPDIKEVAAFGAATQNTALDTQAQMEAILKKYPNKGDITAVWAAWDEFAKGAARAIQQAGRTEIKIYGIDMSDEDLQMIQDTKTSWVASAAVDPKDIGRIQVRYLYQKMHGDETPEKVVLEPVFVSRDQLPKEQISTADLSKHVKGWGGSEQGYTDWMKKAEVK
ncbi:simple sugar transport system substrate-binding protein [Paenibacillus sp. UNCCL117]|uniref:sugar ABC transporter substrate-binding protein n=1 Tax=unclassified Paenibacillus TaxID=185978 RepID=UPI0008832580|nr:MULTISPECIES: sugar ABC transporter substrate-binding protein [unclassified Paenibacillus]SDD61940.1 monosaccharide ABC transporter substrate-binding protein, CUT2 family [Paenibacillus sp. cl123]SFW67584.1 simple sugar transport system substrate-binding protein [Paenibacillus sp. UNCCL117]